MTDLMALADRVEALTGPCRETDADIALALGYARYEVPISGTDRAGPWSRLEERWQSPQGFNNQNLPAYTASLDAAMTLVPSWAPPKLYYDFDRNGCACQLQNGLGIDFAGYCGFSRADHPHGWALALTAAALRARAVKEPEA